MSTQQTKATRQDIKYILPERVGDYPDSGGMPSGNYISSNGNELFDPIASFDRANGDWSVRPIYLGLQRPDDVPLYKSFFAITKPSDDPAVTHLAMRAERFNETRKDIIADATSNLLHNEYEYVSEKENQEGNITLKVRVLANDLDNQEFKKGDVLYLHGEYQVDIVGGFKKITYGEYVKIDDAVVESVSVKDEIEGEQLIQHYAILLSKSLQHNYTIDYITLNGVRNYKAGSYEHKVQKTKFAGSTRYYGVKPLTVNADVNSNDIVVDSLTAHIAPMADGKVVEIDDIDVLRLSPNGLVNIFEINDEVLISNSQTDDIGSAHTGGQTVQLSRTNLSRICVTDAEHTPVNAELWDYDLDAGTITWATPLDLSEYTMPVFVKHVQEEVNAVEGLNSSKNWIDSKSQVFSEDIGSTHAENQTIQLSETDLDVIILKDADGTEVDKTLYWTYKSGGSITWNDREQLNVDLSVSVSKYTMPLYAHYSKSVAVANSDDANSTLTLRHKPLHNYPAEGTYISSILPIGDLQVRHSIPFTQRNWDGVWRDEPQGEQLLTNLNLTDYPMRLTDDGAIRDRWMIKFTSSTQFELYGEAMGFVGRFDTLTDLAPIRAATGKPYFVIPKEAFGVDAPWQAQNIVRFNTWATIEPVRLIRVVDPNRNESADDSMTMCLFGDTTEIQ